MMTFYDDRPAEAVGTGLGLLPFAINQPPQGSPLLLVAAVVIGSMTLMAIIAALGSLALMKTARGRKS